jgi:hypothetical protein
MARQNQLRHDAPTDSSAGSLRSPSQCKTPQAESAIEAMFIRNNNSPSMARSMWPACLTSQRSVPADGAADARASPGDVRRLADGFYLGHPRKVVIWPSSALGRCPAKAKPAPSAVSSGEDSAAESMRTGVLLGSLLQRFSQCDAELQCHDQGPGGA